MLLALVIIWLIAVVVVWWWAIFTINGWVKAKMGLPRLRDLL